MHITNRRRIFRILLLLLFIVMLYQVREAYLLHRSINDGKRETERLKDSLRSYGITIDSIAR